MCSLREEKDQVKIWEKDNDLHKRGECIILLSLFICILLALHLTICEINYTFLF